MADRTHKTVEQVTYRLEPREALEAMKEWLTETHGAAFNDDTLMHFCEGGFVEIMTAFDVKEGSNAA